VLPDRIELPVPFAVRSVNAWLFDGSEPALVDCGIGTKLAYTLLLDGVRGAGVDPASLRLYITHGHVDHAGNAHRLHEEFGVDLHAPRTEAPLVESFRVDHARRNDEFAAALAAHGVPTHDVQRLRADADALDHWIDDVPIVGDLADGDRIVLGDVEAAAVSTPGHTAGSTCYWLSEDNDLLSGDTLLETITSNAVELRDADKGRYRQYVRSLEGLRRFVGVECLPGHRTPFTLTDALLDRHLDMHRARRAKILALLDGPRTAYEVFPHIFAGHRSDPVLFMGMAEIVGHLHALELDGAVTCTERDGVRRFAA
jgi:glyoxylase-like metal-dependent hydrolase (beta-lactamase superfamily II)